ncbi:Rhodanese-related sulfurtransferase [Mycolicibacterium chubuense NBB4]|uniref:Rhodanese-related sulfurtransferase n=1 Tax=Mycolicibacterium chubuense (strain NBB4) TaxID=710421 RepID=I4BN34_MYCCN|nr:rhodanese-like domain-containing protein [Mycolicibacterium chubuense]AFM18691.1 Rhodanese-related sulfurtransferase [Mycolicibacterium chubuense NBB4]
MAAVQEVDIATLARAWESGAPVLDVREDHEFAQAHVPRAQWIPLGELPARVGEVPADTTVYVICASGNRSKRGAEILEDSGRSAVSVAGGTKGWIRAGHPAESG